MIGKNLAQIRKDKKLSMRSLASKTQLSITYLYNIEKDKANPTIDVLQKLTKVLQVSLSELIDTKLLPNRPNSLEDFIDEYKDKYTELTDPGWLQILSNICVRGKRPTKSDDWLTIFLRIRRAIT